MLGSDGGDKGQSFELIRERAGGLLRALVVGTPGKREAVEAEFEELGFKVVGADSSADAIWMAPNLPADLVVVDARDRTSLRLQWCHSFRSTADLCSVPLAAVIGPDQDQLRVELLAADVDECVVGPELSRESMLRIRALLRRASLPARSTGELHYADIVMDPSQLKVWRGGVRVPLSMFQFQLLHLMMISPGKVFSRSELRRLLWRDRDVEDVAIIKCISRLNQSLNAGGAPDIIRRTRSGGYSLDVEAAQNGST